MKTTKHLLSGILALILMSLAACSSEPAFQEEILTPEGSHEEESEKAQDEIAVKMPTKGEEETPTGADTVSPGTDVKPLSDLSKAKEAPKEPKASAPKEKEKEMVLSIGDRATEEVASLPPTTPEAKHVEIISATYEEPLKEGPTYEAAPFSSESLP